MAMETRELADKVRFERMTTEELRRAYVVDTLFAPGEVRLVHWEPERTVIGSAVPISQPLTLPCPAELRASTFNQRREMGVINVGEPGAVTVDGTRHALGKRDMIYVGRGAQQVTFSSDRADAPALFYLVSLAAHAALPTTGIAQAEAETIALGTSANASERVLRRYIHERGVKSCQLVMGATDIQPGSVWNTLPPHTHARRTEIYLYFDLDPSQAVFHFMGPPEATRSLVLRNLQAVLSPPWSVHFGAGTTRYTFVWSMGGENQSFEDMDGVEIARLR
jgi:4-deoxy-L-threo-5-hexosulose-uronate ketol-isomerase